MQRAKRSQTPSSPATDRIVVLLQRYSPQSLALFFSANFLPAPQPQRSCTRQSPESSHWHRLRYNRRSPRRSNFQCMLHSLLCSCSQLTPRSLNPSNNTIRSGSPTFAPRLSTQSSSSSAPIPRTVSKNMGAICQRIREVCFGYPDPQLRKSIKANMKIDSFRSWEWRLFTMFKDGYFLRRSCSDCGICSCLDLLVTPVSAENDWYKSPIDVHSSTNPFHSHQLQLHTRFMATKSGRNREPHYRSLYNAVSSQLCPSPSRRDTR